MILFYNYYFRFDSKHCERRKGSALYNRFLLRHYFIPFHVEMEKPNRAPSAMHGLLTRFLDHDGRSIIKHYLENIISKACKQMIMPWIMSVIYWKCTIHFQRKTPTDISEWLDAGA